PGDSLVSTAQEGLLWHEFFAPGCQNLPGLARRLRGPLDVGALDRALTEIVRRHRPLRTTYELRGGRLRQQVQPEPPSVLAIRDLTSLDASQRATEVDRVVADAGRRPFDLAAGPLFAPALLRLDAEDHVLVIRTHHLAFDEWSVGNFRRELGALYDAFAGGGESPLPEPSVAFDDLAARRRTALAGPEGARQLDHWRRELAGAPLVTQLPVGDPGLPFGTPQPAGGPVVLTLSKEVSDAVRDLARRQRATVFMTLLAAAGVVTGREMGRDDVLLSTIVANRDGAGLGGLIGLFAKKVPVRLRLGGDPTFVEVLARTRRALVGALSAQDLPFEALIQEILAPAAARHGAVPHLAVLVQSVSQGPALSLAGLTTQGLDTARRAPLAHFMAAPAAATPPPATRPWGSGLYWGTFVNLSLDETAAQLTCTARGAFHAPAVRTLLDDLADLIAAVTEDPGRTLSGIRPGSRSPVGASSTDAVDVRGFRIEPARIEACLRECPGVRGVMVHVERDADGEPEIVADVLPDGAPPTIERLRAHLWSRLPGYAWPASIRVSSGPPSGGEGDEGGEASPTAAILHALHREAAGGVGVPDAYWQSFPFLEALSMARDAGVAVPARLAARNRTVEALATAIAAEREASNRGAGPGIR
ncbi:MAG TPA: condensation domain-containing protein, partial [Candidatus Dormibacteraeota bacterium]|nr:condensation domain-containing protein [Candidatus Dormibacteraeota bacterium]